MPSSASRSRRCRTRSAPKTKRPPCPPGLATAATWDPAIAHANGAMIAEEARRKGFNVLLAGAVNLARDPRTGRNFEYAGEDPLLAGTMVGAAIRGIQDKHVISTVKHFALNDQETNRTLLDARIDMAALRESDLLAFELAIERGQPGAVMCSYNLLGGVHACENPTLLEQGAAPGLALPRLGDVGLGRGAFDQRSGAMPGSIRNPAPIGIRAPISASRSPSRWPKARLRRRGSTRWRIASCARCSRAA